MIFTNGQRCEFAKNLRDQAEAWRSMMPGIRMSDRRLTDSIHMAFGLNDVNATVHEVLDMLADLIDRPTCKIILGRELHTAFGNPITWINGYILSCGHQAIGFEKPVYCPECGMKVVE